MTTYQILCLIGVPTIIGMIIKFVGSQIKKICDEKEKERLQRKAEHEEELRQHKEEMDVIKLELDLLKKSNQALLRDRLLQAYTYYTHLGYATTDVKDNYENMYQYYHRLGKNGVMDKKYEVFMNLPPEL